MSKYDLYDLKYSISDYVLPRLKDFKEKYDRKETPTVPKFEDEESLRGRKLTFDEANEHWSKILEEMIFPFECLNNPDKYDAMEYEEMEKRKKNGLLQFAKYFEKLWI